MALVAIEQHLPESQRIVDDALAVRMLPLGGRLFVAFLGVSSIRNWVIAMSEKTNPGIWGGLLCRKRYIDDKILDARPGLEALVNLGAGFDTRPFRLRALSSLPVWEIDQSRNMQTKEKRLVKALRTIPANVQLVAVDFDRDDLSERLGSRGYSPNMKTFFVWEAVSQYLTDRGVRATFEWLAKAARGSRLAFTYVRKSFVEGKNLYGWKAGYKRFVADNLWRFGMEPDDCPASLAEFGWHVLEDVGYDELALRYVVPTGRHLSSTPVERMVYAEKR